MAQLFVPVSSLTQANELKKLLWELTNNDPDNVTKYYEEPIIHPVTNAIRLPINSKRFLISDNANKHLFDTFLQVFVNAGLITNQDVVNIQDKIEANRNQYVDLQKMLPQYWINHLETREQLKNAGWFDYSNEFF